MPGVKHLPSALTRRGLLGAAGADRTPIGRDEVDIHAQALQQVGSDIALCLGDRLILRHDARHRLAGIAAFGQKLFGRIEIALALQDLAAFLGVKRCIRREEARQLAASAANGSGQ